MGGERIVMVLGSETWQAVTSEVGKGPAGLDGRTSFPEDASAVDRDSALVVSCRSAKCDWAIDAHEVLCWPAWLPAPNPSTVGSTNSVDAGPVPQRLEEGERKRHGRPPNAPVAIAVGQGVAAAPTICSHRAGQAIGLRHCTKQSLPMALAVRLQQAGPGACCAILGAPAGSFSSPALPTGARPQPRSWRFVSCPSTPRIIGTAGASKHEEHTPSRP